MKGSSLQINQNGPANQRILQQNMNNNIDDKTGKPLKSLESLAPFNEQEEWAKISQIMESFGSGIVRESVFVNDIESEFKERLGLTCIDESEDEFQDKPKTIKKINKESEIKKWLDSIALPHVEEHLMENGYDDINFLNNIIVSESDLEVCGIPEKDRHKLLEEIIKLPKPLSLAELNKNSKTSQTHTIDTLQKWLSSIHLEEYVNVFE